MLIIRKKFHEIFKKDFARSVAVLTGGTAFSQGLMVLTLPLLTRLYTPEDFGVFAVYTSILVLVSSIACLRFEIAIPMPSIDADAANLLALALCCSATVSVLIAIPAFLFSAEISHLANQSKLRPYLYLLPVSIWIASSFSALQFWAIRRKRFLTLARTGAAQAAGAAVAQIGLGYGHVGPLGLLVGQLVNCGAGVLGLLRDLLRQDRASLRLIHRAGLRRASSIYQRFPKYSTLETLANNASTQLPVVIVSALAGQAEVGFFLLASRVLFGPGLLLGGAISQVYLSDASGHLRAGSLGKFTAQVLGGLAKAGVGPLLFAGIAAPSVFPMIFGSQWQRAGELISWMTPWFVLQFLVSPISIILHITQSQRAAVAIQLLGLIVRIGVVVVVANCALSWIVEAYALSGCVFYMAYLSAVVVAGKIEFDDIAGAISPALPVIGLWVLLGLLVTVAAKNLA